MFRQIRGMTLGAITSAAVGAGLMYEVLNELAGPPPETVGEMQAFNLYWRNALVLLAGATGMLLGAVVGSRLTAVRLSNAERLKHIGYDLNQTPEDLCDPNTLEPFEDPVFILVNGVRITYERSQVSKMLQDDPEHPGWKICSLTKKSFDPAQMQRNEEKAAEVERFIQLQSKGQSEQTSPLLSAVKTEEVLSPKVNGRASPQFFAAAEKLQQVLASPEADAVTQQTEVSASTNVSQTP